MEQRTRPESMSQSRFPDGFRYLRGEQEYVTYREDSTLRVWYADTPWHYDPHWHSAVEIILPVKGEVVYTLAKDTYHVQAGETLIVPPNYIHELSMAKDSARYLFLFEPGPIFEMRDLHAISARLNAPIYLSGQPELQQRAQELLLQVAHSYEHETYLWNTAGYALLMQLYSEIGRAMISQSTQNGEAVRRHIDSDIINGALLYIDENCMMNISLDDAAGFTGFSKYYFSHVFKQQVGMSFSEYLQRRRVALAENLLIHSRQQIQDVAAAADFGSVATFNRVFRDIKQCTPSRYRKLYGGAK